MIKFISLMVFLLTASLLYSEDTFSNFNINDITNSDVSGNNLVMVITTNIITNIVTNYLDKTTYQNGLSNKAVNINQPEKLNFSIGAAGGNVSGAGISFRFWPGELGLELTFIPVITPTSTFINLGVCALKELYWADWSRFYLYAGTVGLIVKSGSTDDSVIFLSAGGGFEIFVTKNIGLNFLVGLSGCIPLNQQSSIINNASYAILPSGEFGLYYNF